MQLFREVLERVAAGERAFKPADESAAAFGEFQLIANRLIEAKNKGFIHDLKVMKTNDRSRGGIAIAMVVGGLTFPGEQFLAAPPVVPTPPPKAPPVDASLEIFISHCSEDSDAAASFISFLRAALPVDPGKIRCTSVEGYRLPAGSSFNEQLRREVFESKVFVALLSEKSMSSTYVLFELGARWGAEKYMAPVMIKGASSASLKQPISALHSIGCSSVSDVSGLAEHVGKLLELPIHPYGVYAGALNSFCTGFSSPQ